MNNSPTVKRTGNYKRRWNTEIVKQYIKDNCDGIELLSEYVDMYTKMDFKCSCGNIFTTNWHEFNNKKFPKRQCNSCGRKKPNDPNKITCDFIKEYLNKNNYTCELLSDKYIDCDSKLKFKCECGNIFYASWSNIKSMSGTCKSCAMKQVTHEDFINKISEHLSMFDIIGEYERSDKDIAVRCKRCNNTLYRWPRHIYERGIYCLYCDGSKGEQYISNYLLSNDINFIPQYIFEDCKNINKLRFDFYLPEYNICIEYQGQQHYKVVDFFGGKISFDSQIKRDNIKRQYCNDNNITLIEISYENFNNIDDILDSFLCELKEVV